MYTAQAAIGVRFGMNKRWEVIDLTQWTLAQLFHTFRRTQLTLVTDSTQPSPVYVDLSTLASTYGTSSLSVAAMLLSINQNSLQVTTTGLRLDSKHAQYKDAFKAAYKVTPVNGVNVVDTSVLTTSLPNVRLTNDSKAIDYTYFFQHCLVNVNGFYHRIDTDGVNGVMVVDAMKTLVKSGQNQIGLWSFTDVAQLSIVPITTGMVDQTTAQQPVITLAQDMTGKSLMLVIGGYLVLVDGAALTQVGVSSYKIDFTQLSIVDRYYESRNYLDLTSLDLTVGVGNSAQVAVADLTTPAAILAWLQLSQSFAVVVDCDELYVQKLPVQRTGLPNTYRCWQQPTSPMVLELGRMPPYWDTKEDEQWGLAIYDNVIGNKLYNTVPTPEWLSTSGADMPGMPGHLSRAYLLEVGRDVGTAPAIPMMLPHHTPEFAFTPQV